MASSSPLSLFPNPQYSLPRNLSRSKMQHKDGSAPGELKGIALQVITPKIQPATDHIKHSLFCEPVISQSKYPERTSSRAPFRARRRSSATSSPLSERGTTPISAVDKVSPLSGSTPTSATSSPSRRLPPRRARAGPPKDISIRRPAAGEVIDDDQLSPLPEKTKFNVRSSPPSEYPSPGSLRSGSPTLARSNSGATGRASPLETHPMRSIFPQYDHSRPINQQHYYPTNVSPASSLPSDKISRAGTPVDRQPRERFDSVVTLVEGYEHIPVAESGDLLAIWMASSGKSHIKSRKVQLSLHRAPGAAITIGRSSDELLYSMEAALQPGPTKPQQGKQFAVLKHCIKESTTTPAAQFALPVVESSKASSNPDTICIFPQMAAVHAIEVVAKSYAAVEISKSDPTGTSPAAARLAQDAVARSRREHQCDLVRGTTSGSYSLSHPSQGSFTITVKNTTSNYTREKRPKISLHHSSATPSAIAADTLVLASVDFARDSCVLDTPGLLALGCPFIIDIAITAMLAVAAVEMDAIVTEVVKFAAPPKSPYAPKSKSNKRESTSSDLVKTKRLFRRSAIMKKAKDEVFGEQVELPLVTRGALALVGFSFKAAFVVLEGGVKATASVVTHLAKKV